MGKNMSRHMEETMKAIRGRLGIGFQDSMNGRAASADFWERLMLPKQNRTRPKLYRYRSIPFGN